MPLYIVATPIGNLADITYRAVTILSTVDHLFAEDTRVSRKLLDHYGITTKVSPYHDFNKERIIPRIISMLQSEKDVALISDAGTPGIADPAFSVVRAALRCGITVIPVPGPSACITALAAGGLPTDRFVFENFLPRKSAARRRLFATLSDEPRTVVFYETPHRILKVLQELDEVLGSVPVVIGREMTKKFEEFMRGTPKMLLEQFNAKAPRGEMVIMINVRGEIYNDKSEENNAE